jgi:hypothetical protein
MRIPMRTIRTLLAFLALAIPAALFGQLSISISIAPPALPVYEQPICPGDGYLWTPGYWAYDDGISDYYWVDGEWVMAPQEGYLWTPGYWGWGDGGYRFNEGYWGPEVGFYGGINYGYGYYGEGYGGGRWDHGHFFYNRSESRVDVAIIHNVYNERVDHGRDDKRVSFNGGNGGIDVRANSQQETAARQSHVAPVAAQTGHAQTARANPELRASSTQGKPPIATSPRPEAVYDHQATDPTRVVEASRSAGTGGATEPRVDSQAKPLDSPQPRTAVHPNDLAPVQRPEPTNSGNAKADKKYQQQQDTLIAKQNQERQSLQQRQDSEHQRLTQQKASDAQAQQLEQKHRQQTQQLSDRHAAQQQSMQARQPEPRPQQDHPDKKH